MKKNDDLHQTPENQDKEIRDENTESNVSFETSKKVQDAELETTENDGSTGDIIQAPGEEAETGIAGEAHEEISNGTLVEEIADHEAASVTDKALADVVVSEASAVHAHLAMDIADQIHEAESEAQKVAEEAEDDDLHEAETDYTALSKDELVQALEVAVNVEDVSKTKNRISLIKVEFLKKIKEDKQEQYRKFIADGGHEEDYKPAPDPAEEKFQQLFEIYKAKKALHDEQQEKQKLENLALKHKLLEELKVLVNSEETLKKTYDEFRSLQEKWKEIGQVPRGDINDLWQNYHFLVEKFFDKVKINKELKDLDLRKNLEQKIQLCEKAEELLLSPSIHKSFKQLQKYHDEWKEIGPVPQDKKDEIWERFKTVSDRINQNRKEYYNQLHEDQESNLMAKTALCVNIETLLTEEINSVNAWKAKTTEVEEMMKLWQGIGHAPLKVNDEIWQRFKNSVNTFYNGRKEFFNGLKEQLITNYNLKLNLCLQAEALVSSTNWKQTQSEFLRLQDEWKSIGPVPRKFSDKIWKRFRDANNAFFSAKSYYFSNIKQIEQDNLKKKQDLISQIEEYPVSDDKATNLEALKNFQRSWMETGHVPISQKDKLQNEYRNAINSLLDRLKISAVEAGTFDYRNRIDNIKSQPDANKTIARERIFLDGKISKLQSDINLWENNIGFLAKSKNAEILKEEFEKKIKSAKEELALLKAKLKMLAKG